MTMIALARHGVALLAAISILSYVKADNTLYCIENTDGAYVYDLTMLPWDVVNLTDAAGTHYRATAPMADLQPPFSYCQKPPQYNSPIMQLYDECLPLGVRSQSKLSFLDSSNPKAGFRLVLEGGSNDPFCVTGGRSSIYNFQCDASVPTSSGPKSTLREDPRCSYNVDWSHPGGCPVFHSGATCAQAVPPTPTADQLRYLRHEIMGLTHFNMATFVRDGDPACDKENWNVSPFSSKAATFNPTNLNVSNWVESYKALGAKHAVLTAKHGCGFILFDTKTTLPGGAEYTYSVNRSSVPSFPRNVAREFVETLTAHGLGTGFYYSTGNNFYLGYDNFKQESTLLPGQVNVTLDEYNSIVFSQLNELWSEYGAFTEIWLDHGFAPSQQDKLKTMLATLQPHTAAFNGFGVSNSPVAWVGTETGHPKLPIWSTGCSGGSGDPTASSFCPKGVDTVIQVPKAWFYTPTDTVLPLSDLIPIYHSSVGSNSVLELDFAIDRTGNVHPAHATAYKSLGDWARSCYGTPAGSTTGNGTSLTFKLTGQFIDRVMLQEDVTYGERVRAWAVDVLLNVGDPWVPFVSGTAIGHKQIAVAKSSMSVLAVRLTVSSSMGTPILANFAAFEQCPDQ